jgi:Rap1a immunity proteins
VNQLDSPPAHNSALNVMKFGWCLGWVQALEERISEVHVYACFEEMNAKKEGRPPRSYVGADKDYMSVCLPPDTRPPDLTRVIVKGLGEPPVQLHEPKNGPLKAALRKAFPCPAPAKEEAKPADAKPWLTLVAFSPIATEKDKVKIVLSRDGCTTRRDVRLSLPRLAQGRMEETVSMKIHFRPELEEMVQQDVLRVLL